MNILQRFFFIVLLFPLASCSQTDNQSKLVEVEEILANPSTFVDETIQIQAVVNQVNSEKQLFNVISQKEFRECGIGRCNVNEQLPVRYSGVLPELGKKIEISGTVREIEEGFICEAESIRDIENL